MARIKDEKILMQRVVKMLPKGIPADAIESVECDPIDGGPDMNDPSYWVYLKAGYICPLTECHTIHEDTLTDLKMYVGCIEEWPNDPELKKDKPVAVKQRPISVGFPSGKPKLTLWAGTEDEESFWIHGLKSDQPYAKAYGVRYDLTKEEIATLCAMCGAADSLKGAPGWIKKNGDA